MTKNKINCVSPFAVPLIQLTIEEDTDELQSCHEYMTSTYESNKSKIDKNKNMGNMEALKKLRILEKFPKTKNILLKYVNKVLNEVMTYDADFDITTSWLTETKKGEQCQVHNHKNCFWSGVYYYDDTYDKESGKLVFFNPLVRFSGYKIPARENNPATSEEITSIPKPKSLILFPSFLDHMITTHNDENNRHSLSFNIVPLNLYGSGDSTYDTNWF